MRVAVAVLLCACRSSDVVPDREPLATPSAELPAWFGMPDVPARRIAGRLLDGESRPIAGTLHLRIDAPDATVWEGHDFTIDTDGHFDFGVLRAGQYTLFATAPSVTSRVLGVDTRTSDRGALSLFLLPCSPQWRAVTTSSAPIAGARIDVAGTVIAETDANGAFSICANADPLPVVARAAGFAPVMHRVSNTWMLEHFVLARSIKLRGRVVRPQGQPVSGAAVQPLFVDPVHADLDPYERVRVRVPIPVQVITDEDGRFVMRGIAELDRDVLDEDPLVARYRVRVLAQNLAFEPRATFDARSREEVVVQTPPDQNEPSRSVRGELREGTITGVVVVHEVTTVPSSGTLELLHGELPRGTSTGALMFRDLPVVDAEVCQVEPIIGCVSSTRTRADGHFDLPVSGYLETAATFHVDLRIRHASGRSAVGHAIVTAGTPLDMAPIEIR